MGPTVTPLEVTGSPASGQIKVGVPKMFELDFVKDYGWQIHRWFDLDSAASIDLASKLPASLYQETNILFHCFQISFMGDWRAADYVVGATIELLEKSPARVVIRTLADYEPQGSGIEVSSRYAIYPTGRIGLNCILRNKHAQPQYVDAAEYLYTAVRHTLTWAVSDLLGQKATSFTRSSGPMPRPSLLVVNTNIGGTLTFDSSTSRYWDAGGVQLDPNVDYVRSGVLAVAPSGQMLEKLQARADDVLQPQLIGVSGASQVDDGYLEHEAAYVLEATANGTVKFGVGNAHTRHTPAFVIRSWTSEKWKISSDDGKPIVDSNNPTGKKGIAHYNASTKELVFVSVDIITPQASAEARSFTLTDSL